MEIRTCQKCGFILGTRPNLKDVDGVCTACINHEKKKHIDFPSRQKWLTEYIKENKTNKNYDCLVAVSGGKDSTTIVRRLFENHGVKKILLVNVTEEFTHTKTGIHNLSNIIEKFNCDLITFRINPDELSETIKVGLIEQLHPLKWLEEQIYQIPLDIAKNYGIKLVFYGENAEFEYGSSEELEIFHHATNEDLKVIYMGAIYPYCAQTWYACAKEVGFIDLNFFNEWQRQGQIENYSQVDSIGYNMGVWTKFVKFGFQRVSDMACRFVRDGDLTKEQAQKLIKEQDYICDPASKRDMCRVIGITEEFFDEMVDKHANKDLVVKDINGSWRRKDLI
jgi:diphthamide synthase (EF-2-diphthine--ammonia ligase)